MGENVTTRGVDLLGLPTGARTARSPARKSETSHRLRTAATCSMLISEARFRRVRIPCRLSGTDSNGRPASDTSSVLYLFQTGSTPRLSYTPPSVRRIGFDEGACS